MVENMLSFISISSSNMNGHHCYVQTNNSDHHHNQSCICCVQIKIQENKVNVRTSISIQGSTDLQ